MAAMEHLYERNQYFLRSAYCAVCDPAALQDTEAETTGRRVWVTEDVSFVRIDNISAKSMLLRVWQVSYGDPDSREIESRFSPQSVKRRCIQMPHSSISRKGWYILCSVPRRRIQVVT